MQRCTRCKTMFRWKSFIYKLYQKDALICLRGEASQYVRVGAWAPARSRPFFAAVEVSQSIRFSEADTFTVARLALLTDVVTEWLKLFVAVASTFEVVRLRRCSLKVLANALAGTDECNCGHTFQCVSKKPFPMCRLRVHFCNNVVDCILDKSDEWKYKYDPYLARVPSSCSRKAVLLLFPTHLWWWNNDVVKNVAFGIRYSQPGLQSWR